MTPFLAVDPVALIRSPLLLLLLLLPLVIIHELGHFISAKAFGIKVLEFGVGFPPRIKRLAWRRGETEYTINWLPIGGFVRLLGEEDPGDPRSLAAAAPWKRLIVIYAGVAINFVAAIALFSFGFMIPRERSLSLAQITFVEPGSPASEALIEGTMQDGSDPLQGLQPGDIVLEAEGRDIANTFELVYVNRLNLGETQEWVVKRGSSLLTAEVFARWDPPAGQGPTGVLIGSPSTCADVDDEGNGINCQLLYPFTESVQYFAPWDTIPRGWQALVDNVVLTKNELQVRLGGGTDGASLNGGEGPIVNSPVGLAAATNEIVKEAGWRPLIELAALLSLSLAVFNFLPIPALDGGRALFIWIEMIRGGKRISPEREGMIHFAGMVLLLAFIAFIMILDVERLIA
jgi:regulator of sigma E protease